MGQTQRKLSILKRGTSVYIITGPKDYLCSNFSTRSDSNRGANSEEIVDFAERNERLHGTTEGLLLLEF